MRKKNDYHDSIQSQIRLAHKKQDAEMAVYYINALNFAAVIDFDGFKGAWCYDNQDKIAAVEAEYKRFAYMR